MEALDILRNEHGLIRQFLDSLHLAAERMEEGARPPKEFFEKAIEFARGFTDKFHHFKEEYVMFAQLAQKRRGAIDAQIDALRYQQERGRNYIAEIGNALDGYGRGRDVQATTVLENLAAYISLLRHHIHREDHVFYPMVAREFSEGELRSLLDLFRQEEAKAGGQAVENSRTLLEEMSALL